MPRAKNNPAFDPDKLEAEVYKTVVELFNSPSNPNHDVSFVAGELQISDLKARKLLITAGERDGKTYYTSPLATRIQTLRAEGKTLKEIEEIMGISHASVVGYLPVSRTIYGMRELSADAIRIKRYRERQMLCTSYTGDVEGMDKAAEEEYLWNVMEKLSGCIFYTCEGEGRTGEKFRYTIAVGEDGIPAGEMIIAGKDISITRDTVMKTYWKVKEKGEPGTDPVGEDKDEASYLYAVLQRLGINQGTVP